MGARYNPNINGKPGWLFPKSKESIARKYVEQGIVEQQEPSQDTGTEYKSFSASLSDILKRLAVIEEKCGIIQNSSPQKISALPGIPFDEDDDADDVPVVPVKRLLKIKKQNL